MRHSEFWARMEQHLGRTYAPVWASNQVIGDLQNRTAQDALADGVEPKIVWRAVHAYLELPARER